MSESNKPSEPDVLKKPECIRFVQEVLKIENPDLKIYSSRRMQSYAKLNDKLDEDIDIVLAIQDENDKEFHSVIIVEKTLRMENRTELHRTYGLKRLKADVNTLTVTKNARNKILIVTNRSNFYALEKYYKYTRKMSVSSTTLENFILDEPNVEIRLVEFPVFQNSSNNMQSKVENYSLTFSQILGGFQYGLFGLKDLPTQGYLEAPKEKRGFNDPKSAENLISTTWRDENLNPIQVDIRALVAFLYEKTGFMTKRKGGISNSRRKITPGVN